MFALIFILFFSGLYDPHVIHGEILTPTTEKEYFESGRRLMAQGELEEALEMFGAVLSKNPQHTPSYLFLGMIYTRLNQLDLAIISFKAATEINENLLAAYLFLGQSYAAKGLNEKAKAAFERGILIDPNFPRGHFLLGILYESEDKIAEALKRYRATASLEGDSGEIKQAKSKVEKFQKEAKRYNDEGQEALKKGNIEQAQTAFRKSLAIDSENVFALYHLVTIFIEKDEFEKAEQLLTQAFQKKSDFFAARLLIGEAFEQKGEFGRAIREYKTVLVALEGQNTQNAELARQKLNEIGDTEQIAELVQTLLKKGTELFGQQQYEGAKGAFVTVISLLPKQIFAHYKLGQLALITGKYRKAVSGFSATIEIDPTHYLSHLGSAQAYEWLDKTDLALEAYQAAADLRPGFAKPKLGLAKLYEKQERIDEALLTYHQITAFPEGKEKSGKTVAQGRIDFYEKRFKVDFSSTSITYDSNSNRTEDPVAEIESNASLGLIHFLKKRERFRLSLRLSVSTRLLHRVQLFFISEGISLVSTWNLPNYIIVQGLNFDMGRSGGVRTETERSFSSTTYMTEIIKFFDFPSEATLHFDIQRLKVFNNPIFSSNRRTVRLSLFQNLKVQQTTLGRIGLSYSFLDNAVQANDQRRRSQTLSLNYNMPLLPRLSAAIGVTRRYERFLHPDSLSLSEGRSETRRNDFTSFNLGLTYRPEPGMSFFLRYVKNKNQSNLPTAAVIDLVSLNAGQAGSLGSYDRELFIFGASAAMDLKRPYPRWKNFQKRISVALSVGYFKPSLKNLNAIIADPKQVIIQDPNHLFPQNPTFNSEAKNIATGPIGGNLSSGVEIEWEMKPRHALVLSISEWQNETISQDQIPLLLSPNSDPIMVPRSARYNLVINQFLLTWRYALFNDPSVGRFYINIGLVGGVFSNLTIDSLMKVTNPPVGGDFASLGSMEARSRSFSSRFGFGGHFFIRSWFSIGLDFNYLFAEAADLEVKRQFPADFASPTSAPGIVDEACNRLAGTQTEGETLSVFDCEDNESIEGRRGRFLRLRLDGFEAKLMLRFHFGEGISGKTAFERLLGWDKEGREKSLVERLFPSSVREKLRINGVFKNETAYRIKEPVSFTKSLFLFRLNSRYALTKKMAITARTRSFYDVIYDLVDIDTISPRRFPKTILTQLPENPSAEEVSAIDIRNSRSVDIVQSGLEFREVFLDINLKNVDFRIGRQIVNWGVVPGARVTDEINPFDFSEFILRETDDRFIPLMMLRSNYFVGDSRFELIWIPEIVPHRPAPRGSEFEQFEILPGFTPTESFLDSDLKLNSAAFKNSELAFRMMQNFNGLELAVTAFYTWDDFPTSFRSIDDVGGEFDASRTAPDFFPEQRRIKILGTTLSKSIGRLVLNAEYAYTFDKFFGTLLTVGEVNPTFGEAQRDYMKYALGIDFAYRGTDLSFSLLQQYIFNWNANILQDRIDTVLSFFGRKAFMNEQIVTQMLVLYFINDEDVLLRPVVETRLSDNVKFRFGADFFIGDRGPRVGEFDFIGFFKDSDRFYLEIIRSF